ncbi:hypothetical protein BOX15_Mlig015780g2, partial [Macrostomum lignano]
LAMSHVVEDLLERHSLLDRPKKPRMINGESAVEYRWRVLRNCVKSVSDDIMKEDALNLFVSHGIVPGRSLSHAQPITDFLLLPQLPNPLLTLDGAFLRFYDSEGRLADVVAPPKPIARLAYASHVGQFVGWTEGGRTLINLSGEFAVLTEATTEAPLTQVLYNANKEEVLSFEPGQITSWVFRFGNRHLLPRRRLQAGLPADRGFSLVALEDTAAKRQRAFCAMDRSVHVLLLQQGQCAAVHRDLHSDAISAVHFFNPMKLLCTGAKDGSVKAWVADTFRVHCVFVGHNGAVNALHFYPTGPMLLSASEDRSVRVWHLELRDQVDEVRLDSAADPDAETPLRLAAQFGAAAFYTSGARSVRAWRVQEIYTHRASLCAPVLRIQASPPRPGQPPRVLVTCQDSSVHVVSPATGAILSSALAGGSGLAGEAPQVAAAAYSTDPKRHRLYCAMSDGSLAEWDPDSRPARLLRSWPSPGPGCECRCLALYEYAAGGGASKSLLVAGRADGSLCTYGEQGPDYAVDGHGNKGVLELEANPSQDQVVSAGLDNIIRVWRVFPFVREALAPLMQFFCAHTPVCMSALRSLLLVGFQDAQSATYSVVTYDLEDKSRQDHSPEDDHLDKLTGAAACPKLRLFATVSQDGTLRVWSSANQLLKAVQLHARPQGVAFCSDTGDLLLGIGASLYGIEHRRYLPKMQTRRMAMMHFEPAAPEPLSGEMNERLLAELPFPDRQRLLACRPAHSFDAFADPDPLEEEPDDVEERLAREAAFGTIASRERELRMLRDGDIKPKRRPAATPATKEEAFNKFLLLVADHPVLPPPPKEANLDAAVKSALEPPQLPRPKQAYRPDICPGFFPSQDAAVRPQAGLAPIPRGGCVPNSVLAKLLWPQEALLEHEKTATQASARGWRPPDLNVEQLRQLQGLRQRGSEDEAERQALLKSWADSGDGAGGDDEDEEEAGELLFELDADRKRREQQEQEQKEREQSGFMRRMQQAMDEAATEAAAEAAEAEAAAAAAAAAEAEAEAEAARTREASTVSGDSRRPPTRPTRRATQEELAAAARSRSSQSQASPKKRPPPPQKRPSEQRRSAVAASPTAASATASAAATPPSVSRQASEAALTGGQQQQTPQGPLAPPPLPDYVAQFADEDWFDAAFPEPRRRSLPDPLTPATFAGRLLRLLPGAGWPERSAVCRAVQQLQTLESLGRQCQQEARRIVLELLELPPDCGVAEQRDFVRHGLTLLTQGGPDKPLLTELLLWYFEGDELTQSFVMEALNFLGRKDEHHCLERELDQWDVWSVTEPEKRRPHLRRAISDWLERWLANFRAAVRQTAERLARGEQLQGRVPQAATAAASGKPMTVTFETAPDPSRLADSGTYMEAVNYFCETQLSQQLARLRSKKRSSMRAGRPAAARAAGTGEAEAEPARKNTILVLPTLPQRTSLMRLGESHGDVQPARRRDFGAGGVGTLVAAAATDSSQPAACQPGRAYQQVMRGGFAPLMHLPMKPVRLNPFPSLLDDLDWEAATQPVLLTLKCSGRMFIPALSQVQQD